MDDHFLPLPWLLQILSREYLVMFLMSLSSYLTREVPFGKVSTRLLNQHCSWLPSFGQANFLLSFGFDILSQLGHSHNGPPLFSLGVREAHITHSLTVTHSLTLVPSIVSREGWQHNDQEEKDGAEGSENGNCQKDLNSKQWLHDNVLLRILKAGHTHHFHSSFTPALKLHSFSC